MRRLLSARRPHLTAEIMRERITRKAVRLDISPRARVGEAMITLAIRQYETELAWLDELPPKFS